MKPALIFAGLSLGGCDVETQPLLTPDVFDAELKAEPSEAVPNRLCNLVGADGRSFALQIRGGPPRSSDSEAGNWEVVAPREWSAKAVASKFEMGIGGTSTHLWRTSHGDVSARVEWCDECPRDGTDSTITLYDFSGNAFAGVCRPINLEVQNSGSPS